MQRKQLVRFYLMRIENDFTVRMLDITRSETQAHRANIDPMIMWLLNSDRDVDDLLYNVLARFNGYNPASQDAGDLIHRYLISSNVQTIEDRYHRNSTYQISECQFRVPVEATQALMFLGPLDSMLHQLTYHMSETDRLNTRIEFYRDQAPDLTNSLDYCHRAFTDEPLEANQAKPSLSRYMAEWMAGELRAYAALTGEQQQCLQTLDELLQLESLSLTPPIRNRLYPPPSFDKLLEAHCSTADEVMKEVLNPAVSHLVSMPKLVTFVRSRLATKKSAEDTDTTKAVHAELSDWFAGMHNHKRVLWLETVKSLYGKPAVDGGFYHQNYTELYLLNEATFKLRSDGLVELCYLDTNAYDQHYKSGRLHDELSKELQQACGDLDLTFLPNQDFHQQAIFDVQSSRTLKDRGMHITEALIKDTLRKEFLLRQCRTFVVPTVIRQLIADYVNVAAHQNPAIEPAGTVLRMTQ